MKRCMRTEQAVATHSKRVVERRWRGQPALVEYHVVESFCELPARSNAAV
jgi:hypothetical protein